MPYNFYRVSQLHYFNKYIKTINFFILFYSSFYTIVRMKFVSIIHIIEEKDQNNIFS